MNRHARISLALLVTTGAGLPLVSGCQSAPRQTAEVAAPPPATPIEQSANREEVIALLERAGESADPLLRANAIEALQEAPARATPLIRRGLFDTNQGVRFVSAMSVGQLKLRELEPQVQGLIYDSEPVVRAAAKYALSRLGEPVDLSPLASLLKSQDPRIRSQAAFILGELGQSSAVPMLREAARDDLPRAPTAEVRILRLQIAEALTKLGDPQAIETIRAALFPSRPEDLEAAALAVQIIGEVNDRRSVSQLIFLTAQDGESKLPAEVRLAAAASLARLGQPNGAFIADEYLASQVPAIRAQVAYVYGQVGSPANLGKLATLMSDDSGLVQVAAGAAALRILERTAGDAGRSSASVPAQDSIR